MKKTMSVMVQFYRTGAEKKRQQAEEAEAELEKLNATLCMANVQAKALDRFNDSIPPNIYKFADDLPTTAPVAKPKPGAARRAKIPGPVEPSRVEGQDGYTVNGEKLSILTSKTPEVVTSREHPRVAEYRDRLESERETLTKLVPKFERLAKEHRLLSEWADGIVRAMEWLETNMDEYCDSELGLKTGGVAARVRRKKKIEPLTPEQAEEFRKGLQEVTYNLQESQDFFDASLDGRLVKYLEIEKNAIEAQLEAIRRFPEHLDRRRIVEAELMADLESVKDSLAVDASRNEHMVALHSDFWRILLWQRETLQSMGIKVDINPSPQ